MIKHKNIIILIDKNNNLPVLHSFRAHAESAKTIDKLIMDDKKIDLINMQITDDRSKIMTKQELMDWHFQSKRQIDFDTHGIYGYEQVYEEIINKNDFILLYCALKDTATAFKVEEIRKGIFSFIFGKYKNRNLKDISLNTNDLRKFENEKVSYKEQPTTRLFRLNKREVYLSAECSDLNKYREDYTFSTK